MKKALLKATSLTTILMMAMALVQDVSAQSSSQQVVGTLRGDSLNVRTGPGSNFQDIGDIRRNRNVNVIGYNSTGRWAKIWWRGREAWVSAVYLTGGVGGQNLANTNQQQALGMFVVTGAHAVDPHGLAFRAGPGTNHPLKGYIGDNVSVEVLSFHRNGRWAFIRLNNQKGYVAMKFLRPVGVQNFSNNNQPQKLGTHVVTGTHAVDINGLALRSGPGTNHPLKGYIGDGVQVEVLSLHRNGRWAFIRHNNRKSYVSMKFLRPVRRQNQTGQQTSNSQTSQNSGSTQTPTIVPAPDGGELPAVFTVTNVQINDRLHVRDQANASANTLHAYEPNTPIVALAYLSNGWAQVNVRNELGYVNGNFLTRGGGVQTQSGMQLGLMCRGTEPFWTLAIDEDRTVRFNDLITGAAPITSLISASQSPLTNTYPYNFTALPYSGTLDQKICKDGISDKTFGWGISLVRQNQNGDWENLNGCCSLQ